MGENSSQCDRLWYVAQQLVEEAKSVLFAQQEGHGRRIQIKYNQLVSNLSCVGDIIAAMFQREMVTLKEFEQIQHLRSTPIRASEELLSIIARKPRDVFESFLSIIRDTNQLHLYQMLLSDDDTCEKATSEDSTDHKNLIRRNFMWLSEKLDTENGLISWLYQKNVLTVREREGFYCIKNNFQKSELLLGLLCKKSPKDFETFLEALEASDQSYLAKTLKETGDSPADPTAVTSADSAARIICHKKLPKTLKKAGQKSFPVRSLSKPVVAPKKLPTSAQQLVASRSLSKPLPPPKPGIWQSRPIGQSNSESKCSFLKPTEKTFRFRKTDGLIFQKRLKEPELTVQAEIAVKVTSVTCLDRPTDCLKLCSQALLKEIDQRRKEIFTKIDEASKELRQLRKLASQCSAAESLSEGYRTQLDSVQQELTSDRLQSKKELMQLEEKMHSLKSDIKNEQAKTKRIEEAILTKNALIATIENKLEKTECEKQSYKQEINKLNARLSSIEYELKNYEESFREAKAQVNLQRNESEQLRNASKLLRNEIRNDAEIQFYQTQKTNDHLQSQVLTQEILLEEKTGFNLTEEETLATNEQQKDAVEFNSLKTRISKLQGELENERYRRRVLFVKFRDEKLQLEEKTIKVGSTENYIIRRNHQFLVENIKSNCLIDLLRYNKNCITDEERHQLIRHQFDFYRNDALLQWMRTIPIMHENAGKMIECFRQDDQKFIADLFQHGGEICGLTSLYKEVFVSRLKRKVIEVYDSTTFVFKRRLVVEGLTNPSNLVSCSINNCLYITDSGEVDSSIFKIDLINGKLIEVLNIDLYGNKNLLSVANDSNLIVSIDSEASLYEYTSDGEFIRTINLCCDSDCWVTSNIAPTHAVKLDNDLFMICQNKPNVVYLISTKETCSHGHAGRIDEIEILKQFTKLSGELDDTFGCPDYLSVDKNGSILVSSKNDLRAVLLSPNLDEARIILVSEQLAMKSSTRTCFDESTGEWLLTDGRLIMACRVEDEKIETKIYELSVSKTIKTS